MYSVFIVEDEIVVATSIKEMLESEGYEVCGISTGYKAALKELSKLSPDLILCDINLGEKVTGIDLMHEVKQKYDVAFMFISAYTNLDIIKQANETSPLNYITKPFNPAQLLVSVERAFQEIGRNISNNELTPREKHILQLIAGGYSSKEIADLISISQFTIETHRKNMVKKLNVKNINELISKAVSNKWIEYKANA